MLFKAFFYRYFRWSLLVVLLFLAWQAVVFLRPRPRPYLLEEARAVEAAVEAGIAALRERLPGTTRLGVVHLLDDPQDTATEALRHGLTEVPGWSVPEGSVIRRFLGGVGSAVMNATSLDEVASAGRRVDLDVVLAGRLADVSATNGTGRATLHLYAYDTRPGDWVLRERFEAQWRPHLGQRAVQQAANTVAKVSPRARLLLWLGFTLLLPWGTPFVTRWGVAQGSNRASALVVAGYALLSAVAAALLSLPSGGAQGGRLLAAALLGGVYSFWACERIARPR